MKRLHNIFIAALGVLLLASCAKEPLEGDAAQGAGNASISLSLTDEGAAPGTRADEGNIGGTPEENLVKDVKLLFYKAGAAAPAVTITTGTAGVTLSDGKVSFPQTALENIPYARVIALANCSDKSILISEESNRSNGRSKITTEPVPADGLIMSGEITNTNFYTTPAATILLYRQAVKFRITVLWDDYFKDVAKIEELNEVGKLPQIMANHIPSLSFLYGNPDATRFNELAGKTGWALLDYPYKQLKKNPDTTPANLWEAVFYGHENLVSGQTNTDRKRATNFILKLPYRQTNADGTKTDVTDNYYKVLIDTKADEITRYQTQRNMIYDIKVKVIGYGSNVPSIDGLDVLTTVTPWNAAPNPIDTPNKGLLELSNTECNIYSDKDDKKEFTVCQVIMRRNLGASTKLTIGKEDGTYGSGIELVGNVEPMVEQNKPIDIKVRVTAPFKENTITLTCGGYTHRLIVRTSYERSSLTFSNCTSAISDAQWCTLSDQPTYVHADQRRSLLSKNPVPMYLTIHRTTLENDPRMGTVTFVRERATPAEKTTTRVIVLQKPYIQIQPNGPKWAPGNVTLGYRPDGKMCYVIGGPADYGLWFRFGRSVSYLYEGKADGTPWDANTSKYYLPNSDIIAPIVTEGQSPISWQHVFSRDYGQADNVEPDNSNIDYNIVSDPCRFVYSSNLNIKWRSPTQSELQTLVVSSTKWLEDNPEGAKGLLCPAGIFLRCAGGRNGGYWKNGTIRGAETGGNPMAMYWSSDRIDWNGSFVRKKAAGVKSSIGGDWGIAVGPLDISTANSMRCVRKEDNK